MVCLDLFFYFFKNNCSLMLINNWRRTVSENGILFAPKTAFILSL